MIKNYLLFLVLLFILSSSFALGKEEKRGRDVPMIITSDHALWNKEKGITILTGNVKVVKKEEDIYAKKIEVWGDFNDIKKIVGYDDILIINKKEKVEITGDYLEYHKEKDYALITGEPKLIAEKDKLEITSQKMEKYFQEHLSVASHNVIITKEDTKATGELLNFFEDEEKAILTGAPKLFQKENVFSGDKVIFYTNEDKVEICGNVKSVIYIEEEKSKDE